MTGTGYIVSYNASSGFGFIRPDDASAQEKGRTPRDQASDDDLVLFHDEDLVKPGSWDPREGLRVSYEPSGKREDLYLVVKAVAPAAVDAEVDADQSLPEGSMILESDDAAF